ncbi:UNVERIFIED_CONTAM: hypothetical protein ABID98_000649 [Brevibacillus sp. OAP136]
MKRSLQFMLATGLAVVVAATGMEIPQAFGATTTSTAAQEKGAACSIKVVRSKTAEGPVVASGSTQLLPNENGRIYFYASHRGDWAMMDQSGKQVDQGVRQSFVSNPLLNGKYTLTFTPKDTKCGTWSTTINVESVTIYQGAEGSGQKIAPKQIVNVTELPANLQFTASYPGQWTVGGINETVYETKTFQFTVPAQFAGLSIPVTYVPNGGDDDSSTQFFIQAGGKQNSSSSGTPSDFDMDVVSQINANSTPTEEKEGLAQNASVTIYQNSLYKLWVTPNAEAFIKDRVEYQEADPGFWTVNNVLATNDHLNWNDTALNLASYGAGTYKVMYLSKTDATRQWTGTIQIVKDAKPASSRGSCDPVESGSAPAAQKLSLQTDKGAILPNGGTVIVSTQAELSDYRALKLTGTHAVKTGMQKINKDNVKSNIHYVHVPKVEWVSEPLTFGEQHEYSGGRISSANRVEVRYNNTVLASLVPSTGDDDEEVDGETALNVAALIAKNGNKAGNYTINIENTLSNLTCGYEENADSYDKVLGTNTMKQTYTMTITLK